MAEEARASDPIAAVRPWQGWLDSLCGDLDVDTRLIDVALIHSVGARVARLVARPLAPVTAFLLGEAAVRGVALSIASADLIEVPAHRAVILAGGTGARLGGVTKADLTLGGQRLLDRVLAATGAATEVVVVGQVAVPEGVRQVVESPPGSGPAAGLAAGLEASRLEPGGESDWILLLGCDLPAPTAGVWQLLWAALTAPADVDGLCLLGREGNLEWLFGLYRTSSLTAALEQYGDPRNRSLRGLVGGLRLQGLSPANPQLLTDLDTWEDHAHWEGLLAGTDDVDPSWRAWADAAAQQLAVRSVNVAELLAIARSVAHRTVRQLAPVVAFALGVAAAQGQEPGRSRELVLAALPE